MTPTCWWQHCSQKPDAIINDYFKNEEKKSIASINAEKRKNSGLAIISVLIILLVAAGYFIRVIYLKKKILGNLLEAENLKNETRSMTQKIEYGFPNGSQEEP
ncbi:MAG: hypothetical protein K2I45_09230 [Muribaculaceae bacterium]|nr:hypothetical protein [Muribaculaceae bacterium]